MDQPLSVFDRDLLKKALELGHQIEKKLFLRVSKDSDFLSENNARIHSRFESLNESLKDSPFSSHIDNDLARFMAALTSLGSSEHQWLQKCSLYADHLYPGISHREFLNILVPLERTLDRHLPEEDYLLTDSDRVLIEKTHSEKPLILVLDHLRSAFNVGSIFRLADGLGIQEIVLCGYTATPETKAVEKTSLGAEAGISWKHFNQTQEAILDLKKRQVKIIGLETSKRATSIFEVQFFGNSKDQTRISNLFEKKETEYAILIGNERFGLNHETLGACDLLVSIPMVGVKNSLNVVSALSILVFEWMRQYALYSKSHEQS